MIVAALVIQNAVRLLGLILLVLGLRFWTGHSLRFIPVHMRIGEVVIALLWILSGIGLRKGVPGGNSQEGLGTATTILTFAGSFDDAR